MLKIQSKFLAKHLVDSLDGKAHYVEITARKRCHTDVANPFLNAVCASLIERFVGFHVIGNLFVRQFLKRHVGGYGKLMLFVYGCQANACNYLMGATRYAQGWKVGLGATNRNYKGVVRATYSSGLLDNGWAFAAQIAFRGTPYINKKGFIGEGINYYSFGYFFSAEIEKEFKKIVIDNHMEDYVILYGKKHGEELDNLFNKCDFGIGSLGRHRVGIDKIKTLKNREYAARGIPFIYSETDSDFDTKPYVLKVPADESPASVQDIIDFYKKNSMNPQQIRDSIKELSWKYQMGHVIEEVLSQ